MAQCVGAETPSHADPGLEILGLAPLGQAGPDELSSSFDQTNEELLGTTSAGVLLVKPHDVGKAACTAILLLTDRPAVGFSRLASAFYGSDDPLGGVDPTRPVHPDAEIGVNCHIGPGVVVAPGARIGDGCRIGPGALIGRGVALGSGCRVGAQVTLTHGLVGRDVAIGPGTRIGQSGFVVKGSMEDATRLAHLGRVVIGDRTEIGANCTIDRGAVGDTIIGPYCWMDNLVHVAHDVQMGRGCRIIAMAGIAGAATLGEGVVLGGQVGIGPDVTLGDGCRVMAKSMVFRSVPAGGEVGGIPAVAGRQFLRQAAIAARFARGGGGRKDGA